MSCSKNKTGEIMRRKRWAYFNPKIDMRDMKFNKGMTFSTIEEFKDTVVKYSIAKRYNLRFSKNEANRAKVNVLLVTVPLDCAIHLKIL